MGKIKTPPLANAKKRFKIGDHVELNSIGKVVFSRGSKLLTEKSGVVKGFSRDGSQLRIRLYGNTSITNYWPEYWKVSIECKELDRELEMVGRDESQSFPSPATTATGTPSQPVEKVDSTRTEFKPPYDADIVLPVPWVKPETHVRSLPIAVRPLSGWQRLWNFVRGFSLS